MPEQKINVYGKFAIKTLPCYRCKCWGVWSLFGPHAGEIRTKSYNPKCWKCLVFWPKKKKTDFSVPFLRKRVDAILQDVSIAKTINDKLLIFRLLSFSVPKIIVIRHVQPGLKLHQTWQIRPVWNAQSVALRHLLLMRYLI